MGDRRLTQFLHYLRTIAGPSVLSDVLHTLWTNRLPPNIQVIIAMQTQVAFNDVAQLANKTAEVMTPTCVSSSGNDIYTLIACIDELARQVAALSARPSRPHSPSQTRRGSHQPLTSAGTTAVSKNVQRDAARRARRLYVTEQLT